MIVVTPFLEAVFRAGFETTGRFLIAHTQVGLHAVIFLVGVVLMLVSRHGFIGIAIENPREIRRLSLLLLGVAAAAIAWSVLFEGDRYLAIGVPLLVLFGVREYLVAGLTDRDGVG